MKNLYKSSHVQKTTQFVWLESYVQIDSFQEEMGEIIERTQKEFSNLNTEVQESLSEKEVQSYEIYDEYLSSFKRAIGYFEIREGGDIFFVDKKYKNREYDAIKIPQSKFASISKNDFINFVNKEIRYQDPIHATEDDYWEILAEGAEYNVRSATYLEKYKDSPHSEEIFNSFARNMAHNSFYTFLNSSDNIIKVIGKEKYAELILIVAKKIIQKNSVNGFRYADLIINIIGEEKYDALMAPTLKELSKEDIKKYASVTQMSLKIGSIAMKIPSEVLKNLDMHKNISLNEKRRYIAKYLYYRNLESSTENLNNAVQEINEKHKLLENVPLFKDRNITFLANDELNSKEDSSSYRFGTNETQEKIKAQTDPEKWKFIRPENTNYSEVRKKKLEFKEQVINSKSPCTFILDGHGYKNNFSLNNSLLFNNITANEFVDYLVERHQKINENDVPIENRPIFLFMACFQANLIEKVFRKLKKKGIVPPIMVSSAEYDQPGMSTGGSQYGSESFAKDLDLLNSSSENPTTFGTIYEHQSSVRTEYVGQSNMMIWAPSKNEKGEISPVQIVENNVSNGDVENNLMA